MNGTPKRAAPAALVALAAALTWACSREAPLAPSPARSPYLIAPSVMIVDTASSLRLYDITADEVVFDTTGGFVPTPGTLLVGSERGGFIRRAFGAQRSGDRLVVRTSPAFLTEAVVRGAIDTVLIFSAAPPAVPGGLVAANPGVALDGISLLPPGAGPSGAEVVIERGRIEYDPLIAIRLAIDGRRITRLEVAARGQLTFDLLLAARFAAPLAYSGRTEIASFRRPLNASIGPLPVPLEATLSFYADLAVDGEFADRCRAGYRARHLIEAALEYDGDWNCAPVSAVSHREEPVFSCGDWTDCRIAVAVSAELEVSFYAADRARIELSPRLVIDVETETPPYRSWKLTGGLSTGASFAAGVLDRHATDFSPAGAGDTVLLADGPFATPEYIFVAEWGTGDILLRPRGVAVGENGTVYVTDQERHRVVVFDNGGEAISAWGGYGQAHGMFIFPVGVAVDRNGFVYVCDSGNHRIQKFGPDGAFLAAWGREGTGPGEFVQPEGIAAGPDTLLAVCDSATGSVTLLGASGTEIARWQNGFAHGAAFDAAGNLFVSGCQATGVTKYSPAGERLERWEHDEAGNPRFDCPLDIAIGPAGRIVVLEYGAGRFVTLSSTGETLSSLGESGSGPGQFSRPGGIAVSPAGWIFVADTFNDRLQVFAPR